MKPSFFIRFVSGLIAILMSSFIALANELTPLKPTSEVDCKILFSKEKYSEIKKSLGASKITKVNFDDGQSFYVAHKGSQRSLLVLKDKFEPVTFEFNRGDTSNWAYKFGFTKYNGKYYVFGSSTPNNAKGLLRLDGHWAMPEACVGPIYGYTTSDGGLDLFYGSDHKGVTAYMDEYGHFLGTTENGQEFTYVTPREAEVVTVENDVKMYKDSNPYVFYVKGENGKTQVNIVERKANGEVFFTYGNDATIIPENGYFVFGDPKPIQYRKRVRHNAKGENEEFDEVFIQRGSKNTITLFDTHGRKIIGNVHSILISHPDDVVYYVKTPEGSDIRRKGAIDLRNRDCSVPPAFNDVFIERTEQGSAVPYVKTSLFSDIVPYDPELDTAYKLLDNTNADFESGYTVAYDAELKTASEALLKPLIKRLSQEFESDTISFEHMRIYSLSKIIEADALIDTQSWIVDCYNNQDKDKITYIEKVLVEDPDNYNNKTYGIKDMNSLEEVIAKFKSYGSKPNCVDADFTDLTVDRLTQTLYLADIYRKTDIPQARSRYLTNAIAQYKKEQAEAERRRKQEQTAAILNFFADAVSNPRYSSHSSKTRTSGGKSNSVSSKSSSSSSSSSNDNSADAKRDRKAWLKIQIIELENKVNKARAAFEEAARIDASQNTRESKRAMESKKRTLEEFMGQLNQYKMELSSLK